MTAPTSRALRERLEKLHIDDLELIQVILDLGDYQHERDDDEPTVATIVDNVVRSRRDEPTRTPDWPCSCGSPSVIETLHRADLPCVRVTLTPVHLANHVQNPSFETNALGWHAPAMSGLDAQPTPRHAQQ